MNNDEYLILMDKVYDYIKNEVRFCILIKDNIRLYTPLKQFMSDIKLDYENNNLIYRDKPFWSWNGKIEKKEVKRQIEVFKEMGFGGFFIHSRTGLKTTYMGREWLRLVKYAIKISSKLGLEAYLYDEDRYPSGQAGGYSTREKRFCQKYVCVEISDTYDPIRYEFVFDVFNAKFDGEYLVSYSKYNPNSKDKVLIFYLDFSEVSTARNGFRKLDTLNREATENFINETHEKYRKKCGKDFGKKVFGIFTDEVSYGQIFSRVLTSERISKNKIPYTNGLFEEFENRYGFNLIEKLPEIFFSRKNENIRKIMWQYVELIQSLFIENFAKPYHEWCVKNRIAFTGHVLQEETLTTQSVNCGAIMRFYEHMDYPGVDILSENGKNEWFVKQLTSVSKQFDKKFSCSECYGGTGYLMTFEKYKMIGDYQAALGVNFRVPHLSWYTMGGRAKRDYPASFSYHSCWCRDFSFLEDYMSRLNSIISKGKSITDVCVIDPVESVWAMLKVDSVHEETFFAKSKDIIEVEENFSNTFYALSNGGIDFDYLNEDTCKRYGKIVREKDDVYIQVCNAIYHTVVVSDCVNIRKETYDLLLEFAQYGGEVIINSNLLKYINFDEASKYNFENIVLVKDCQELVGVVKEKKSLVEVCGNIVYNLKKDEENYYLFAVDLDRNTNHGNREIIINDLMSVYEIDLPFNRLIKVNTRIEDNKTIISLSFDKGMSHLLVFNKDKKEKFCEEKENTIDKQIEIPSDFEYELLEENVMVLDFPKYSVDGKEFEEKYILSIDNELREKHMLEKRREMSTQPWFREKYWKNYNKHICDLTLSYSVEIKHKPKYLFFVMENLNGCKSICVNGKELKRKSCGYWIDKCFSKIKVPIDYLKQGVNLINVVYDFKDSIDLEAMYLIGNFGVSSNGKEIIELPKKLKIGDIVNQGLPFYGGEIIYKTDISSSSKVVVDFNGINGVTQNVIFGDKVEQVPFYPYKSNANRINGKLAFKIDLSRNNTFGAIHNKDIYSTWCGPFSFEDIMNNCFSKDFVFCKQGLLVKPNVYTIKEKENGQS